MEKHPGRPVTITEDGARTSYFLAGPITLHVVGWNASGDPLGSLLVAVSPDAQIEFDVYDESVDPAKQPAPAPVDDFAFRRDRASEA